MRGKTLYALLAIGVILALLASCRPAATPTTPPPATPITVPTTPPPLQKVATFIWTQ